MNTFCAYYPFCGSNYFYEKALYVDKSTKIEDEILLEQGFKTVGQHWATLQKEKFGEQTQPLFVILNHKGEQISKKTIGYSEANNGGLLPFLKSIE
ncbi:MAG: hypothetical protein AB8G11_20265 [Saprospiraceae bacterium]